MKLITTALSLLFVGFAKSVIIQGGIEIPTFLEPCRRNTPEFNECLRSSLQLLMAKLKRSGVPELGLQGLDPLIVDEFIINYGGRNVAGKVTINDSHTRGLSAVKIIEVRSKTDNPNFLGMEIDFYIPRIIKYGVYKMDGHVGKFPVTGKGVYNITATDLIGTWRLTGSLVENAGEKYMRIDRVSVRPEIGNMKIYASDLIKDNPELSQAALAFVNRFWKVLYEEMYPYAGKQFDIFLTEMINKIFLKVPYDQLFPPATPEDE